MSSQVQTLTAQNAVAIDPKGLEALRRLNSQDSQAGAKAVAQQFEALLMQQMLSAMRQANKGFSEEGDSAGGLFRSMQDQQWAQLPAFKNGLGLTDAITRQINQQRGSLLQTGTGKSAEVSSVNVPVQVLAAKPATEAASNADGFVGKLAKVAESAASALGVSPGLLVAHAALETGWGQRTIKTADGKDSYNLFGIKAGRNWTGKTAEITTTEYVDGKAQKRVESFRAYDSYADAFADYAGLLQRRYAAATGQGNDAAGFGQALQDGGYATDPGYASKITKVAQRVSSQLAARQRSSSPVA